MNRMIFDAGVSPPPRTMFVASDPRVAVAVFAAIIVFTFVVPRTEGLVVLLAYVVLLHRLCRLPLRSLAITLANLSFFLVVIILINAYFVKGAPLPAPLGFLSREGIVAGVYYGLRVLVLYLSMTVFLAITSPEGIASSISAFLRPVSVGLARRAAFYSFVSISFMPLFADEARRISVAQHFRGGGVQGGVRRRLAGVRLLLVPLILSAVRRSGQLAMAVELRGVRRSIGRLLALKRPVARDYLFTVVTAAVLAAAILMA